MSSVHEWKAKVPVFDEAYIFDCWEIQWNAFAEVEGIAYALGPELNPKMPVNSKAVLDPAVDDVKPKMVASKANKRAMVYFALAFKTMKLLRLITKAKTEAWPGGEVWKVKKALSENYRPDGVLTVSALKKRLNAVSLKGKQDPSDMFEELAAIEHAYLETEATLGSQYLSGAVQVFRLHSH
jgi:hypothetical protein